MRLLKHPELGARRVSHWLERTRATRGTRLKMNFGADGGSRSTVRPARGNGDAVLKAAMHSFEACERRVALFDNDWQP
jgi:hypothetical protein